MTTFDLRMGPVCSPTNDYDPMLEINRDARPPQSLAGLLPLLRWGNCGRPSPYRGDPRTILGYRNRYLCALALNLVPWGGCYEFFCEHVRGPWYSYMGGR